MSDELKSVAEQLVAHCRNGTEAEGLSTLYADDAVSVEAVDMGQGRASPGLEAIAAKHAWWDGAMEVHSAEVDGPFLHGPDRFAVTFSLDATEKATGNRSQMKEVGIYTVGSGKIVREEFFYTM